MNKKNNIGLGIAVGSALAATAAAYFLYGAKDAKKRRAKIRGWALKAKGEVLEKLEVLTDINKDTYQTIVKQILSRYNNAKHIGKEEIADLEKELGNYWKHLKKEMEAEGKKAVKKVRKSAVKIAKAGK
ncbi:MAG: hypothetical protein U1D31_01850 [Patescibacteria group bacterium]|nr:hypothetical protein [bacterium]MDZ4240849.1 hypothetical protein [Patescibacteria group bacterium]